MEKVPAPRQGREGRRAKAEAEAKAAEAAKAAEVAKKKEAEQAAAPARAAATPAAESAAGLLAMAQQMHDKHVADGEQQRDKIIAEAQIEASSLVNDAQEKSRKILGALEQQRSVLERKVEQLRGFERDYRSRLKPTSKASCVTWMPAAPWLPLRSKPPAKVFSKYSESRWLRIPRPPAFGINRRFRPRPCPSTRFPVPALARERKPYD